jgi:hypothetical protein
MEVILLIVGFIAFVVSFFIPDRGESSDEEGFTRDEIREIVLEEYEASKSKLEDITDETVNYSIEKAERSLDKITNEKMLALGEYSDTIMNQINTNPAFLGYRVGPNGAMFFNPNTGKWEKVKS